jgi:hypothetical protein
MSEPMTAKEIIEHEGELFMNSPIGYEFAERVEKSNVGGLKSFLINIFAGADDVTGDAIRAASHEEVVQTLLNNNFTFDPEWFGKRELPKGIDGRPISRLDDPEYRRAKGLGHGV